MSTFYVRKDGSGTHTTIQSAFIQAVSGDVIDVGPGLFEENVDFYKNGITLKGAGKTQTEIRGVLESNSQKACTFTSGSTTINIPAGTSGWIVGRYIQGTGLAANARIVSVSANSVTISVATTSARTNQNIIMPAVPSAVVVRGANHKIQDLKITGVQALESRCLADNAAIFFRNTGNGEVPASGYTLENCTIEARGESAIMTDATAAIGNGIIRNNTIQGKTFVGASAAQVPSFGTMSKTGTVLSNRTIQFSDLSGITAPHAGNSQGSEITPGLRVASISGNVVTVTVNIPDAVGTSRSFSFANVQFNFPNVPRQLVVVQGVNTSTQFVNNTVNGVTGSGITYNTAATVDAPNSTITGNTLNGQFKFGYALRARGAGSNVSNNINYSLPGNENAGYLIGPTGSQVAGPVVGTNTSIAATLVESAQVLGDSFVSFEMSKEVLKQNSVVSSHPTFSNEANWNMVSYVFKHDSSSRRLVGSFKDFSSTKKSKLKVNMEAGDRFELHKIILATSPRDLLVLKRSQISGASGFDFDLLNDGPEASDGGGNTPSVVSFELFQNYPTYSPLVDPTTLTRTLSGLGQPISLALSNQSLGALSSGVGNFDVTFNFEDLSDTSGRGTYFGILFSDSSSVSLSDVNSGYEDSSYLLIVDSNVDIGTKTIGTGGYTTSTGVVGSVKSLRFLQEGDNQLKIYQDDSLIKTISVASVSKLYAYPFVRSYFQHKIVSVETSASEATTPSAIAWVNPSPNVYNIEADGGLTNGVNRGGDRYKNIIAESQVLSGDFEISFTYNSSNIGDSTAFGIYEVSSGLFDGVICGAATAGGWGPHVNNSWLGTGFPLGTSFSITRVGTLVTFLINGSPIYSYTSSKTYVPLANLTGISTASLESASVSY